MSSQSQNGDALLALLLPLCLFMLGLQLLGRPRLSIKTVLDIIKGRPALPRNNHGYFSHDRAASAYDAYQRMSLDELGAMRTSYATISRAHKRIGYELGYPSKLDRLAHAIHANAAVTRALADLARSLHPGGTLRVDPASADSGDLARVREALRHFVRDWSSEGRRERNVIFEPIIRVLEEVHASRRADTRVLVPGAGLGRLAWEISKLGFNTTAVELSAFMTLPLRFLLSEITTTHTEQHTIYPYPHWFSHQRKNENTFRTVSFPDEIPRLTSTFQLSEGDFLKHHAPNPGYDFIVTLFFIDTSPNIISTIEHIHALLRPGGTWINLGPLLWASSAQARLELSLEEVLELAHKTGFSIHNSDTSSGAGSESDTPRRRKTVVCEYTADPNAMMQWLYHAEFWVATKRDDSDEVD